MKHIPIMKLKKKLHSRLSDLKHGGGQDNKLNMSVTCGDGCAFVSPLVLATLSSWLCRELQDLWSAAEDIALVVPDLSVADLSIFLRLLFAPRVDEKSLAKSQGSLSEVLRSLGSDYTIKFPEKEEENTEDDWDGAQYLSDVDIPSLSNETLRQNFSDQNSRLVCLVCYKIFDPENHEAYKAHIQNHSRALLKRVKILQPRKNVAIKKRRTSCDRDSIPPVEQRRICPFCQKMIASLSGYKAHLQSHEVKRYQCLLCQKLFGNSNRLQKHLDKQVCQDDARRCLECHKLFADKTRLTIHMRLHRGEKPFACQVCSKTFTQKRSLTEHALTHQAQRGFTCTICDKEFVQANHLKYHQASIHGMTTAVAGGGHECGECKKVFAFQSQLKQHGKVHLPIGQT